MEQLELAIQEIKQEMPGLELKENEPMSGHCSFRIGGPVRALAAPQDVTGLTRLCYLLKKHELAPYILGNGTNILFPDEGLKDLFIISTEKLTKMFLLPDGAIYAEAGVSLSKLASFAQQNGLTGLEFASGIPGSVGGGLMMNAGAYGGELKDAVESVVIHFLPEQALYELTNEQCAFGYRSSFFQKMPGCVILSGVFRLEKGEPEKIAEKMRELNAKRREKQPLDLPSAGSAFKRPEGGFAAALIDEAGLQGLYRRRGAGVGKARGLCGQHRRRHVPRRVRSHDAHTPHGLGAQQGRARAGDDHPPAGLQARGPRPPGAAAPRLGRNGK